MSFDISQISCCAHILNFIVEKVTKLQQGKYETQEIIPLDELYEENLKKMTDLDDNPNFTTFDWVSKCQLVKTFKTFKMLY